LEKTSVVVTGLGLVTPVGVGVEPFWNNITAGISGIKHVTPYDSVLEPIKYAGQVDPAEFEPKCFLTRNKQLKFLTRHAQFAMAAAKMAFDDARLGGCAIDPNRMGVYLGTLFGQPSIKDDLDIIFSSESEFMPGKMDTARYGAYFAEHINPIDTLKNITNLMACHIAIAHDARGPVNTFIDACTSGAQAIGSALQTIQRGEADIMLAGGADASIFRQCLIDFFLLFPAAATGEESTPAICRPFDARRRGFVPGEGAGFVVLENLQNARRRNALIYGRLKGYGLSHGGLTQGALQAATSAEFSMQKALENAGIDASQVDYINANGDSTIVGDRLETTAIKKTFGNCARRIPISSTKSMTGHLLAAAGAVELIASLLALRENIIPPTINYEYPDPECDLDYVPNQARERELNIVLSNSIGWLGQSASLIVEK
jgi:3-oxoacyl-[acyl-carrier-protein] synthase II